MDIMYFCFVTSNAESSILMVIKKFINRVITKYPLNDNLIKGLKISLLDLFLRNRNSV